MSMVLYMMGVTFWKMNAFIVFQIFHAARITISMKNHKHKTNLSLQFLMQFEATSSQKEQLAIFAGGRVVV
jgi:hypothetical protein